MKLINLPSFADYELIDSGNFEKLERFGKYFLARPEPQAVWRKKLSEGEWERLWTAKFTRNQKTSDENGQWELRKGMPEQWIIGYKNEDLFIKMRLGLTSFKHVGIFPEQADNWNFIYNSIKKIPVEKPNVLNLFAYTGGASLAAAAAGGDVTHLDSVKQVVTWARENMEASGLSGVRWLVEDALSYLRREVKRGKQYHGLILDPPAYGRGPDGEKWVLEKNIDELLSLCSKLLLPHQSFFVINLYSMGFSSLVTENLVKDHFSNLKEYEFGEIYVSDNSQRRLPLGTFLRFFKP